MGSKRATVVIVKTAPTPLRRAATGAVCTVILAAGALACLLAVHYGYRNDAERADMARYTRTAGDTVATCAQWLNLSPARRRAAAGHLLIAHDHLAGQRGDADYRPPSHARADAFAAVVTDECRAAPPGRIVAAAARGIYTRGTSGAR
jgi:hypothetical protein